MTKLFPTADAVLVKTQARKVENAGEASSQHEDFIVRHLAGTAVGDYGVLDSTFGDRLSGSIRVAPMARSVGEWAAVAESAEGGNTTYLVFGDAYGYAPIFYTIVPGLGLVLSTSFNGVVGKLEELGVSRELNVDNYIAALSTWHEQFAMLSPTKTMAKEIGLLPLDKAIKIDGARVTFVPREGLSEIDSSASYEELLSAGNDFSANAISKIGGLEGNQKGLLLSGGVDSRLVLSLILFAKMEKEFRVRTADPRGYSSAYTRGVYEKDVRIANEIRHSYGMSWMTKGDVYSVPVSFRESLMMHQEYGSNFSYAFKPVQRQRMEKSPVITLRGGGGEILRSTDTGATVGGSISGNKNFDGLSIEGKFAEWLIGNAVIDTGSSERIREFAQVAIGAMGGATLDERLNVHYLHTRNRAHFGHARRSRSQNELPFQLLSNSFYLAASSKISFEEKANGKMVADIFKATTPALLDFPFESSVWNAKLASSRAARRKIHPSAWVDELNRVKNQKATNNLVWAPMERGEGVAVTDEGLAAYLKAALQQIEDTVDEDLEDFHSQIIAETRNRNLNIRLLVGKVASAVDVLFPSVPLGTTVTLETAPSSTVDTISSAAISLPSVAQDGWNNYSVSDFAPKLRLQEHTIEMDAGPVTNESVGLTFAFYLYRGDECVEKHWYGPEMRSEFSSVVEPGDYRGRLFVKSPRSSRPLLIRDTEILRIAG